MCCDYLHSRNGRDLSNHIINVLRLIARLINYSTRKKWEQSNLLWALFGPCRSSFLARLFCFRGRQVGMRWVRAVYHQRWAFLDKQIRWLLSQSVWYWCLYFVGWETTYDWCLAKAKPTLGETARNSFEFRVRIKAMAETDPEDPLLLWSTKLIFWRVWSRGRNIGVSCK